MTFTIPEFQISLVCYVLVAVMILDGTMTFVSEYQRYKFFKKVKSFKELEEWKVNK